MAWDLILWLLFFLINITLLSSALYQLICLSDLEGDYINSFELSTRINAVMLPEFILQGVYSALFLLTGHWFMFLVTLPINYFNFMLYIKRTHLIDVTEVFTILSGEKRIRIIKFGFYFIIFCLVMVRVMLFLFNSLADEADTYVVF